MKKILRAVKIVECDKDRVVGQVILWVFAIVGVVDIATGGVLWH